jgi:hypothetical protein
MLQRVEEAAQICIEHRVHFLSRDPDRQRIQRLMRAALGSKSVREAKKVLLVDRIQHLNDSVLDDLVLQHGHPQRASPTVFRYEHSTHGSCSVRASLEPQRQVLKVVLQALSVVLPRLTIHTCRRVSLDSKKGRSQSFDVVHMVQKRGEPLFLILP